MKRLLVLLLSVCLLVPLCACGDLEPMEEMDGDVAAPQTTTTADPVVRVTFPEGLTSVDSVSASAVRS